MPTYDYRCEKCNNCFEKFHAISFDGDVFCPECEGKATKLLSPSTIIYKGSGFYTTDYCFSNVNGKNNSKTNNDGIIKSNDKSGDNNGTPKREPHDK